MSERAALLRHIIAHPDDDAPRLVMADWLDEHGESDRAEFIRLQVAFAQQDIADAREPVPEITTSATPYMYNTPAERRRQLERMRVLYERHREAWTADVAKWARPKVHFSRGFISHISATAIQWLKGAAGLHRAAPVTDVKLQVSSGELINVAAKPQLADVSTLTVETHGINTGDGVAFAESPHLGRLRSLTVVDWWNDTVRPTGGLEQILRAPWPCLRRLNINLPDLSDDTLPYLANNPAARSLLQLRLSGPISPAGAETLADSPHLASVVHLSSAGTRIGNAGPAIILRSPHLTSLRQLHLWAASIEAEGVRTLVNEPALSRIEWLDLSHNPIGDGGAIALAESPGVEGLRELNLCWCGIEEPGMQALLRSPHLDGVRRLQLTGNRVIPSTASALLERFGERVELPSE